MAKKRSKKAKKTRRKRDWRFMTDAEVQALATFIAGAIAANVRRKKRI